MEESEFRLLVKHCFLMGKNAIQTQQWLEKCYGNASPSKTKVFQWFGDFEQGRTGNDDVKHDDDIQKPE